MSRVHFLASLVILALAAGCKAQTTPTTPTDAGLTRRIEVMVRSKFNVPPDYNVLLGPRKPSQIPGYDSLPVVLSRNTGHLDLIEDGNCYPLLEQQPERAHWRGVNGVAGWGESRVDEVVAQLEAVFADRAQARQRGARAAQTLAGLSWSETARQMAAIVLDRAEP